MLARSDDHSAVAAAADTTVTSDRQRIILSIMAECGRPISTTELARIVGQTLGATAHHVRALARRGLIEWAGERRVRGAMQTFYVVTEHGTAALKRPRLDALMTLFGVVPTDGDRLLPIPDFDAEARAELQALVAELRPRVERILAGAVARRAV
jgi:predicted ArsR family transcriptional regulator